jgi:hypothetical protein
MDEIYESISRDFSNDPKCIKLLAEKEMISNNNSAEKAISVFETNIQVAVCKRKLIFEEGCASGSVVGVPYLL